MKRTLLALLFLLFLSTPVKAWNILGQPNVLGGVDISEIDMSDAPVTPTGSGVTDSVADITADIYGRGLLEKTATAYSPVLGDQRYLLQMNNAAAQTVTIEPDSTTDYPDGTLLLFQQLGAGALIIQEGAGVTLQPNSTLTASEQYSIVMLTKIANDTWKYSGEAAINANAYTLYGNATAAEGVPSFTTSPVISGELTAATVDVTDSYNINDNVILFSPSSDNNEGSIGVGLGTLQNLSATAGDYYNTALGYEAMKGDSGTPITGVRNVAIGYRAGSTLTTGTSNILLGDGAGDKITTGSSNIVIGANSLGVTNNKTGGFNVAIGSNVLEDGSTADSNVMIGSAVAQKSVSIASSVIIGRSAGRNNSGGQQNVLIGREAMFTATAGSYNVAIGYRAGYSIEQAANNVILGHSVGSNTLSTGGGNILIGTSSAVDTPAGDTINHLNIGNLITGTLAGTKYMEVDGGVAPDNVTADPCGTYPEGSIFYNDTSDYMCFCNGTGDDVQMHSPTTGCF